LQLFLFAQTESYCLDAENNYASYICRALITVPPAVWAQTLKPNKGTLKLSLAATFDQPENCDSLSPGGIPNPLQGTEVQVNLDLVCKPAKSTQKCINTFNGTHGCPACS
jgi:hypothetical protein